jgi:putative membrane protein
MSFLTDCFLWIKALHVISVIAWMAAMLYLPRLYVYHAVVVAEGPESALFKIMERRLARSIMTPSMVLTWVFGLLMIATPGAIDWSSNHWFHIKLLMVFMMSGIHGYLIYCMKAFAKDRNNRSSRFFRVLNEIPAIIMVMIVLLVIVRPG